MQKFEIKDHEPSYLPSGNWKLAWSDEFDGTELDTTKWSFRKYFWGNEFPAFTDKGIVLDGKSHMEMHRVPNGDYYVSPQLQTADGWHYFGMNWQPEGYTFYCDGEIVSQCSEHVSHVPQFILLTTEIMGYRPGVSSKLKKIEGEPVDDAFIVDFVRVYDLEK